MEIEFEIVSVFILILLVPLASYGEQAATLEIDMKSVGGEMTDYHGTALKIYQNNVLIPFKTIDSLSANPYKISLPQGHQYKIEAYVNGMYADVGYVDLQQNSEKLELTIPNPGSVLFTTVYNDGNTPINNATVTVKSNNGIYEYWTPSTTNDQGNTIRFWLQPTILSADYYVVSISIGNDLSYNYYPIKILQGASNNIKIVTPWPAVTPPLVASVYKSSFQKVSKSDGNFVVELYNNKENKIAESKVNVMGEAYFSNLQVGSYILRTIDLDDEKNGAWGVVNMIVDGKQTSVQIHKNQTSNKVLNVSKDVLDSNDHSVEAEPLSISQNLQITSSTDLPFDIKGWVTDSATPISDSKLLSDIGIKANHIPFWVTNIAKWEIDGKISEKDFVNAVEYMHTSGVIK
jgi:hypothetical protein